VINVTLEELEKIQKTVDDALAMHGKWLENLQRIFACRLSPNESDLAVDAHQRCDFGRWFYGKPNSKLREIPAFQQIEKLHTSMHTTVREVCAKLRAVGEIQPDDYDVLLGEVKRFSGALDELRNKVDYTLKNIDPLTGAITNTRLLPNLKAEQEKLRESGQPYSLLLVNVDVKQINYEHSREMGDQVLRTSVTTIKDELEGSGRVYRYSGAEFVVALPGKNQEQAEQIKEQLLERIGEAASNALGKPNGKLNIHYGIVMLDPAAYIEQLIDQCARSTFVFDFDAHKIAGES
jgi:diguanylate cyclase (GGDEF)-like protein